MQRQLLKRGGVACHPNLIFAGNGNSENPDSSEVWVRFPLRAQFFKVLLAQLEERFRDMEEAVDSSSTRNTNSDIAQCESAPVRRERAEV